MVETMVIWQVMIQTANVDTLARFCPDDTIVYVKCTNEKDEHYKELAMMEEELKSVPYFERQAIPPASAAYGECCL